MARKDRTGNRKTREQRKQFKVPELGYYLIVTDTEATERCFFTGLHQALPEDVRNKLVIKVVETKTRTMIDKCLELTAYDAQYRIPWIVFDRDQVQGFDEIIKEAEDKGIQVGWSNPCFEIWLLYHTRANLEGLDFNTAQKCKTLLNDETPGGYNPKSYVLLVKNAMNNAKNADKFKSWYPIIGNTTMYELIESLMQFVSVKEFEEFISKRLY